MYRPRESGHQFVTSHVLVVDESYQKVRTISPSIHATEQQPLGFHELKLFDSSNSVLLISYATLNRPTLLPHCRRSTVEFITTGRFIEMSTDGSNRTLFQWDALDHIEVSEAAVCPGDKKAGKGQSTTDSFDFL
jgi:hypothetical protein